MGDLPAHVKIHEEGQREGFLIEPRPISMADSFDAFPHRGAA
jgi:hypothetical protein